MRADDLLVANVLVVTANWAFSDGTVVADAARKRAARDWLRCIRLATIRSGFGCDGTYGPPAGLDVVLAGDTFDILASAAWQGRDRPWRGGARAEEARRQVLHGCGRRATWLLAGLARLARSGLPVPAADRRGRPSPVAVARVPVRIAMLAGDRDHWLTEAAADIESHGATLAPAWSDGVVLVRHGHEFDPSCHAAVPPGRDRPPTLAESVTVDLVAAFAARLAAAGVPRPAAGPLVEALIAAGPADVPTVFAAWVTGDGPARALGDAGRRDVEAAWSRAVEAWLRASRREPPDCGLSASPLEALAAWFLDPAAAPPSSLRPFVDATPPVAAGVDRAARTLVLGHPASPGGTAAICLGRPPVRRWGPLSVVREPVAAAVACVVAAPVVVGPTTAVGRRVGDRLAWQWLGTSGAPAAYDGIGDVAVVDAA